VKQRHLMSTDSGRVEYTNFIQTVSHISSNEYCYYAGNVSFLPFHTATEQKHGWYMQNVIIDLKAWLPGQDDLLFIIIIICIIINQ